jgi:hypothetical protein
VSIFRIYKSDIEIYLEELEAEARKLANAYTATLTPDQLMEQIQARETPQQQISEIMIGFFRGNSDERIARLLEDWIKRQRAINDKAIAVAA